MEKAKNTLLLLLTSMIWGSAFVAQRTGMEHVGPFTFQVARCFLGALSLLPIILWQKKQQGAQFAAPSLKASLLCGFVLLIACSTQQIGLVSTSASKAGFIGSLYIVVVPVICFFLKQRTPRKIWVSVALSVAGLFLISGLLGGTGGVETGDLWVLASAFFYGVHILVVARFAPHVNGVALSAAQFLVAGLCTIPLALLFEEPTLAGIVDARWGILYTGILSSGVGYTLQIIAQSRVPSTLASLVLSLESVFSLLAGMIVLGESLQGMEWLGCALVLAAVIISQLPEKRRA